MNEIPATSPAPVATPAAAPSRGPSLLHLGIVVGILAGGVLLTALTSDVTQVSEPGIAVKDGRPFLSEKFGDWAGGPLEGLSEQERAILPQDTEGARRVYTDSAGNQVYCSIVLAGRDVTSIHRPELCLPGQGWSIQTSSVEPVTVPSAAGGSLELMRLNTVRNHQLPDGRTVQGRSIFVYWFVGKDRTTAHHLERIFWTTKDRVLHNTNHRWAYILIHSPVRLETNTADEIKRADAAAMKITARFVQDLYPTLVKPAVES